jgi:hypothetical protein
MYPLPGPPPKTRFFLEELGQECGDLLSEFFASRRGMI